MTRLAMAVVPDSVAVARRPFDPVSTRALGAVLLLLVLSFAGMGVGAEIWVTTPNDELDFVPDATCSLREAIITVNDLVGGGVGGCVVSGTLGTDDTIVLPPDTVTVTRRAGGCLASHCGSLNVARDVAIVGYGARTSVIESSLGGEIGEGWSIDVAPGVTALLRDVTVTATEDGGAGGIFNRGDLTLERVAIRGNHATGGDGGGVANVGTLTVVESLVTGNRSSFSGGGLMSREGTLRLDNSTVGDNESVRVGGGIYVRGGTAILSSVTVTGNRAGSGLAPDVSRGAGLDATSGSDVRLENTIVAGNQPVGADHGPDCSGVFDSRGYNLIGVGSDCAGFDEASDLVGTAASSVDPLLGPLGSNGGPTDTYAPTAGSPAIDGGPLQILDACLATDQRGLARANDGDGDGLLQCDIGAVEAPEATQPPEANLEVQLFDLPDPVATSGQLQYQVVVTNHGPSAASGVQIGFVEPDGATVTGFDPLACSLVSTSPDTFACDAGTIAVGTATGVAVDVTAPAAATTLLATATVASSTPDPFAGDDSAQQATVVRSATTADLALQIRAMGYEYVLITEPILYELVVTNAGPDTASGVVVTARIPDGTTFVSASPECARTVINELDLLSCTAGGVTRGASRTFDLFLAAPAQPGLVTLTASASAATDDVDIDDNSDAFTTTVRDVPSADLFIALNGPAGVATESTFDLDLLPFNNGPDASPSVFATLTLPDGAELVDGPAFCEDLGPRVVCGLGDVQAFGSVPSYPLTVRAPATEGTVTFTASIEGASIDPFAANDVTAFEVDVTDPGTEPPPAEPPPAEPPPIDDAPAIAVAQGPSSPPSAAVDVGATSVPALQVRVDNTGTAGAHVTSVALRASGTGDDARDIARVGLVLDNDGDGTVGTGDSLLGTGAFAEDDGTLIVSVSTAVQAGSQQDWLVVVDLADSGASRSAPLLALSGLVLGLGVLRFRRRGSWALAFAAATLWLAASACGATPPDDGGTTTTTHAIALDDLQATDLAGEETVVVTGLPVEGATLRVER